MALHIRQTRWQGSLGPRRRLVASLIGRAARSGGMSIPINAKRSILALGLLISLCDSYQHRLDKLQSRTRDKIEKPKPP